MELTDEQFKTLQQYESYLGTAYKCNYVRTLPLRDAEILHQIYRELGFGSSNIHCSKCVLQICKTLGKLYYNKKSSYEEK